MYDRGRVMTVLGPVGPADMGVTDAHSHLYIGVVPDGPSDAPVLTQVDEIAAELADFKRAGGGSIIDCQPPFCGRDGNVLRQLSVATGIHVVAATGFHRRRYYRPDEPFFDQTAEEAAAFFGDEIRNGLVETRDTADVVYPGFIKIAAEATLEETPRALLEAAAAVCCQTGYAIEMHTERGAAVEAFLRAFSGWGVGPERLVFCHVDKRPDPGLHRELASAGVMLEYDTFYRPKYDPDTNVWPLIEGMVRGGYASSLALATDMAVAALWQRIGGGPGLPGIFNQIRSRLEDLGLDEPTLAALLGGNISGRLAVAAPKAVEEPK